MFEGEDRALQRPSLNYRKKDGGSIILDMFPHWRYVLDSLFGKVKAVSCLGTTHIKQRWDEQGQEYVCTADDSAYSTFQLEGGIIAHFKFFCNFRAGCGTGASSFWLFGSRKHWPVSRSL